MVVSSGYFPYDFLDEPPPKKAQELIGDYRNRGLPLVIWCDANAHHIVWGSTDINSRDNSLLQYLVKTDLRILNRRTELTFSYAVRNEVIDTVFC